MPQSIPASGNADDDDEEARLCAACVGEDYLKAEIQAADEQATCRYCGNPGPTITLEALADRIEGVFDEHMRITSENPSGFERAMYSDWERAGDPTATAIANLAVIEMAPAEDLQEILSERHYDIELAKMGEESPFDADAHYAESSVDDIEFQWDWRAFEEGLRTRGRFFNRAAEAVLSALFSKVNELKSRDGHSVVRTIGPQTEVTRLVRARVFQSEGLFHEAVLEPERLIGSPDSAHASAGRMNARGVSAFYGATDAELALAEVRPPVGSRAIIGEFELLAPLRVLDVQALEEVFIEGSLFDPAFGRRLKHAKFLARLANRIRMPVMPAEEGTDYLATQAMAEYLADRVEPRLDGVLYGSAQGHKGAVNIALFNHAARVEPRSLDGVDHDVWSPREDDYDPNYVVWSENEKPADAALEPQSAPNLAEFLATPIDVSKLESIDEREPTLKLDRETLRVHHVRRICVKTDEYPIAWRTMSKSDDLPF